MRVESGSSLSTFRSCPKKYELAYNERLSSQLYSQALNFGSFVHALRAIYHATKITGADREAQLAAAHADFKRLVDFAKASYPQASDQIQADLSLAQQVVSLWSDYWEKSDSSVNEKFLDWINVEGEWEFPILAPSDQGSLSMEQIGVHVGKRDGYLKHTEYGQHLLYELKTASMYDRDGYIHRLALDHQIASNLIALAREGRPFAGCLYDIIWKPSLRRKTGRKTMPDETLTEFNARIVETIKENPSEYFQRTIIFRREKDLALWERELVEQFRQLNETKVFYRNPNHCTAYGLCQFFEACAAPHPEDFYVCFTKRDRKHPELNTKGE